jgi:hypothetical protein
MKVADLKDELKGYGIEAAKLNKLLKAELVKMVTDERAKL